MTTGTRGEAAYWLGVAELEFDRLHTRVRHLARCFVSAEPVLKQRRPYKKRRESLVRIPGQGGRESEVIPVSSPK